MTITTYQDAAPLVQAMDPSARGPFDRSAWFTLLAENENSAFFITSYHGGQSSILPLIRDGGCVSSLANWYSFVWRPLGVSNTNGLTEIARELRMNAARAVLAPLPDEDGSATALKRAFHNAGWAVQLEHCDHNHVLPVNQRSFAEYWAARPGHMRTTLKRKANKVECEIWTSFNEQVWAEYCTVYRNSWKPEEGAPALLQAFARAEGEAGRIRLAIARYDDRPVAAQFWTVENGVAYIHKLAHLEEYKSLSAGTTLSARLFEHVMDRDKVTLVDFGTGDDPYKRDWMEIDRPRYRLDCLNPSHPSAWLPLAKRAGSQLARKIKHG